METSNLNIIISKGKNKNIYDLYNYKEKWHFETNFTTKITTIWMINSVQIFGWLRSVWLTNIKGCATQ
jgi:hypothetical protein